jgi:hypothetical protein
VRASLMRCESVGRERLGKRWVRTGCSLNLHAQTHSVGITIADRVAINFFKKNVIEVLSFIKWSEWGELQTKGT